MGLIGLVQKVDSVETEEGDKLDEVTADFGGGNVLDPEHFSAPGVDSKPLPGDLVVTSSTPGDVGETAVGYIDTNNVSKAANGETRLYARAPGGAEVCEIWLKGDGSITVTTTLPIPIRLENTLGFVELGANGRVNINDNFTVDP